MFYYNKKTQKAEKINYLVFKKKKINKYRLAYLKYSYVNWCPFLKSVLANDEIKNGKSLRGGHKIIPKKMLQWHLRITKYIPRLIKDFKIIDWPNNIKNSQIKWIGYKKIYIFKIKFINKYIKIYTRKKSKYFKNIIFNYPSNCIDILLLKNNNKKKIIKLINKLTNKNKFFKILINIKNNYNKRIKFFISNYYKNFYLNNIYLDYNNDNFFLNIKNNLTINIKNYKIYFNFTFKKKYISNLKNIVFSRQRYWGEPFPIYYKNNIPYPIKKIPLKLPIVKKEDFLLKKFNLNKNKKWAWDDIEKKVTYNKFINFRKKIYPIDKNTMPSFAASNWYYLRYINPNYNKFLVNKREIKYWGNVDLYIGGSEHTNGHLLYSRFCNKFLYDLNIIKFKEPFKKFINQGLILNHTYILYKYKNYVISYDIINKYKSKILTKLYINKELIIENNIIDINNKYFKNYKFKKNKNKQILCKITIQKMSKSKFNIITPDSIIKKYGTDCYRLYVIFLGPFNKKKIWSLKKIKGIKRFLTKIWNYCLIKKNKKINKNYRKTLNNYIYNIHINFNKFLLNKNISLFMEIFNFLIKYKIYNLKMKKKILILLSAYIPYMTEEIWYKLGNKKSIYYEKINILKIKKRIKYLIMINNKVKEILFIKNKNNNKEYLFKIIKKKKYLKNNIFIKKIIFIKNKIINILI
ncbi:MAG: class I tRNA ligase family protein [Candidatus Shikimatogenerans sp. JK-2022]|nr:class I tRNA ligase family protein [Candidatus Shikimatogenerans bostrichidophilus]